MSITSLNPLPENNPATLKEAVAKANAESLEAKNIVYIARYIIWNDETEEVQDKKVNTFTSEQIDLLEQDYSLCKIFGFSVNGQEEMRS